MVKNWNRISHISKFCGSICFLDCTETLHVSYVHPCVVGRGLESSGVSGTTVPAGRSLESNKILLVTPKMHEEVWRS